MAKTKYNICKTWFKKGDKDRYFKDCLGCGGKISIENITHALEAMESFNVSEQTHKIHNDSLIIAAANDRTYALHHQQTLHQKIHNSKLITLKNCYHNAHRHQSTKFVFNIVRANISNFNAQ